MTVDNLTMSFLFLIDKDRGGKPPRPPNCFILYRSDKVEEIRAKQQLSKEKMQKDISKLVAGMYLFSCT